MDRLVDAILAKVEPVIDAAVVKAVNATLPQFAKTYEDKVSALATEIVNLKAGVKNFAKHVAEKLVLQVRDLSEPDDRSDDEREADEIRVRMSPIPEHAPGMRRKS